MVIVIVTGYWTVQIRAQHRRLKSLSTPAQIVNNTSRVEQRASPSGTFSAAETQNTDLQHPSLLSSLFGAECLNTKQGIDLLSDNYGSVCHRHDLNNEGCCARYIDRYSCKTCRSDVKCCESYEYCVSCCVKKRLLTGRMSVSAQIFSACERDCRTSSRSTRHGNEYKHKFKHCYETEKQSLQLLLLGGNDTKMLALSHPSISCKEACAGLQPKHACSEDLMDSFNSCEVLKSHFPCEAGCKAENRADTPSYMSPTVEAKYHPGACLTNEKSSGLDCNGRHPASRRLCLCLNMDALR